MWASLRKKRMRKNLVDLEDQFNKIVSRYEKELDNYVAQSLQYGLSEDLTPILQAQMIHGLFDTLESEMTPAMRLRWLHNAPSFLLRWKTSFETEIAVFEKKLTAFNVTIMPEWITSCKKRLKEQSNFYGKLLLPISMSQRWFFSYSQLQLALEAYLSAENTYEAKAEQVRQKKITGINARPFHQFDENRYATMREYLAWRTEALAHQQRVIVSHNQFQQLPRNNILVIQVRNYLNQFWIKIKNTLPQFLHPLLHAQRKFVLQCCGIPVQVQSNTSSTHLGKHSPVVANNASSISHSVVPITTIPADLLTATQRALHSMGDCFFTEDWHKVRQKLYGFLDEIPMASESNKRKIDDFLRTKWELSKKVLTPAGWKKGQVFVHPDKNEKCWEIVSKELFVIYVNYAKKRFQLQIQEQVQEIKIRIEELCRQIMGENLPQVVPPNKGVLEISIAEEILKLKQRLLILCKTDFSYEPDLLEEINECIMVCDFLLNMNLNLISEGIGQVHQKVEQVRQEIEQMRQKVEQVRQETEQTRQEAEQVHKETMAQLKEQQREVERSCKRGDEMEKQLEDLRNQLREIENYYHSRTARAVSVNTKGACLGDLQECSITLRNVG